MRSSTDQNSIAYWLPRLVAAGLPVPRTRFVEAASELTGLLDGRRPPAWRAFIDDLHKAMGHVGVPCFLRTSHTSGKHNWADTCYVPSADKNLIGDHVYAIVEYSALADMFGLPTQLWAVRELLPTYPLFSCRAYGGMPVVPEWRYFIKGGMVQHVQPYWPEAALEEGDPSDSAWRNEYRVAMANYPASDSLAKLARAAGNAVDVGTEWSVDLLWSYPRRRWYITDMALGAESYRYDPSQPPVIVVD